MNKFLKGKLYNRCRRAYSLLLAAVQCLHFNRFCEENKISSSSVLQELEAVNFKREEPLPLHLSQILHKYEDFEKSTLARELGKTPQYWMMICRIIQLYLLLHRAMKVRDIKMYAFVLFELAVLFFRTNHMNYARWMVFYALELWSLERDYPGVKSILECGGFSVK